jgi:hypothetical protein
MLCSGGAALLNAFNKLAHCASDNQRGRPPQSLMCLIE